MPPAMHCVMLVSLICQKPCCLTRKVIRKGFVKRGFQKATYAQLLLMKLFSVFDCKASDVKDTVLLEHSHKPGINHVGNSVMGVFV